jgi:hypothetical protein
VTFDDTGVAQAHIATDALRELEHSEWHLMVDPALRRRWGLELLDELADLACALADAVEVASGISGPDVAGPAEQLSRAIRRRRDVLSAGEGTVEETEGPGLPAVENEDGAGAGAGSRGPKHRAGRHLRPVR